MFGKIENMPQLLRMPRSSLLQYGIGLLIAAAALLFLWPGLAGNLFATHFGMEMFMPHRYCYLEVPSLVWLHLTADVLIGISNVAISLTLAYLGHRARRDIPFHWIFLAFGLFIVACGATHFMEVWTLWHATYWLSGYVKLVTAAASVATAVVLPAVVPRTLFLVREAKTSDERKQDLEKANQRLEEELDRRIRAEESLQQTSQTLEAIFQSAPLAIYAVDPDGKTLMWNPAAERIFGWREQETVGRPLPIVSAEDQEDFRQLRERVLRGEAFANLELRRQKKDGARIDVSISTAPLRDAMGEINGMIGITADITDRKQAERTLLETNQTLQALFQASPLAIYTLDAKGNVGLWNPAAERIFGWSAEEAAGRQLQLVTEDHQKECCALRKVVMQGRTLIDVEGRHQKKDGAQISVNISAAPLRDANGDVNGLVVLTADSTERKRIEAALQESEQQYRSVVDNIKEVIFQTDAAGLWMFLNPAWTEITGFTVAESIGTEFLNYVHPEDRQRNLELFRPLIEREKEYCRHEIRYLTKDGGFRWIEVYARLTLAADGTVIGTTGTLNDITERKRAEAALQRSEEYFRALTEHASDIISIVEEDGTRRYISPSVKRILGYKPEELIGMNAFALMHPDDVRNLSGFFNSKKDEPGFVASRELRYRHKDGSWHILETTASNLLNNPAVAGIILNSRDITERKRAEAALRESEERYRELVENANDIIYAYDLTGRFTSINGAGERVTGYTREEILRMDIADVVAPEHLEEARRRIAKIVAGGAPSAYEFELIAKDGSRVALEINSRLNRHGSVAVSIEGIARDITYRRQAETALRQSEQDYRGLFEQAHDAILVFAPEREIVLDVNQRACEIYGFSRAEFIGMSLETISKEVERGEHKVRETLETGDYLNFETVQYRKDGTRMLLEINAAAVRYQGQAAILSINRDITERRHAEEARRESELRFRSLVQSSNDAIVLTNQSNKIILWNKGAQTIFGYAEEEALGQPLSLLMPQRYREAHERGMARYHATGEPHIIGQTVEFDGLRKDGSEFPLELSLAAWETQGERFCSGIIRDITERRRRTEALKESERQLARAQQIAHLGGWELDVAKNRVTWSEELYRVFGLRHEEFKPTFEGYLERVHPDDRALVQRINEKAFRDHQPFAFEHRIVRPDGTVRMTYFMGEVMTDETGKPVKLRGIGQDITERKQAEVERDIERQLLKALIDQLPVGVLVCDMEGRYIKVNRSICEILGTDCDELLGMTIDEAQQLYKPTNPEGTPLTATETPTVMVLRTQRPVNAVESLITTPGGEVRRISSNAAPVIVDGGVPFGSVTVVTDVTEQYTLQEQLRQSQKMESIGTLAGGVAHDFNNLLTVILGNTQLAFRVVQPGSPLQQRLMEVEKAANRATTLTRQLLAFSRRQRLERQRLNLNDTINDIMKMLRRVIGENIEVRVQESIHLHPIFADPSQIEQVVMNLAVNARDAMPNGGQLVIETRNVTLNEEYRREHPYAKSGRYVQMTISDTGTGMDAETRKRIFEPFFTTKETGKGTGLGLSMVYGIVKQHGGLIEVYSEPRQGTSFKIYLPVEEKAVKEEAQEEVQQPLRGGTETILVAEDEEALRSLARSILEELGYTVLLAKDGVEAVELYKANQERIALMLFDIVMPHMGGREAYEQISSLGGDGPVIFMTGYSAEIVQYEFVKQNKFIEAAGAVLMQKPYTVETLGRKVREVLDVMPKS